MRAILLAIVAGMLAVFAATIATAQVPGLMGVSGGFSGGTVPSDTTFSGNVRIDGTLDQRGGISNGGSATCFTGVTGVPCFTEDIAVTAAASALMHLNSTGTTASSQFLLYNGTTAIGGIGAAGSATSITALQSKSWFLGRTTAAQVLGNISNDIAAGSNLIEVRDGANAANLLVVIDGAGNLSLPAGATRSKGTITLVAGTGTATVTSGCVPSCVDTTAANVVRCSVATTTLTAVGTGTDVIAYLCL